jgi:hypothetical protein
MQGGAQHEGFALGLLQMNLGCPMDQGLSLTSLMATSSPFWMLVPARPTGKAPGQQTEGMQNHIGSLAAEGSPCAVLQAVEF